MKRAFRIVLRLLAAMIALVAGFVGYQLIAVRGTFQRTLDASKAPGEPIEVIAYTDWWFNGRAFISGAENSYSPLVVVLHGDAPFQNPGYQYEFASRLSKAAPGTHVIALLRPGYSDPYGSKSRGDRGFATGDNYDEWTMRRVSRAIEVLATDQYKVSSVILVGHSGGAVTAANVAATPGSNVVAAFLIGCPCDVPAFRKHMWELQRSPFWLWPVHAMSPTETEGLLPTMTQIRAISGAEDPIAPPQEAQAYVEKAKARGVDATLTLLPGEGHEILLDQRVIDAVAASVRAHTKTNP